MKPSYPNQKKSYNELSKRLQTYSDEATLWIENLDEQLSHNLVGLSFDDSPFSFDSHPELKETSDNIRNLFVLGLWSVISNGIDEEWNNAKEKVLKLTKNASSVYNEVISDNYNASTSTFKNRTIGGLTTKQRLWRRYYEYKNLLEASISTSVQNGMNASSIKTALDGDLNDVASLRLKYKKKYGTFPDVKDIKYNVTRLVSSEANIAYRESEIQRWRKLDFILGVQIHLSAGHKLNDICDELAGIYPKSFEWYGWHLNDHCYMTPILMSDSQFWTLESDGVKQGEILDVPQNFKQWVDNNLESINTRKSSYFFINDNWNGRLKDYARYKVDTNYKDVVFDYKSGGLKAIHSSHHLDGKKGWYETSVQQIGHTHGHSVILEKEIDNILYYKNTEGLWNGQKMEIAAAENGTKKNIRNALKHCVSKRKAKVAVIFMPNGFTDELEDGIRTFNGLAKKTPEQWQLFNGIFFISPTEGIKELPQLKE